MRLAVTVPIHALIPHRGPMCLLDRALEADQDSLVAELEIRPDSLFHDGNGVGAWVGIEYMAQAAAAHAGWLAHRQAEKGLADGRKIGFLLGSRHYACRRPLFCNGEVLRITVRREFAADNGLAQFECHIDIAGQQVAEAILTVLVPDDANALLSDANHV
ncbi:3-hydroxylacyl-ACP dehydratase [Chitinimonas arctica]|uniref:3-hydroxylacyl-ACP dehydratase n=1 Tax=Chitinimonas arctica TaxID=2594795 RepID=A0A516SI07_9NEIS|nr:3-hydroxylacyl-ACP dehydratase [Chitinimonas arctica]QDQ27791.1 3-hydroxylacyl-ACP dehydratase [Chitinimonas arctica]